MKFSLVAIVVTIVLGSCSKEEVPLPYEEQLAKDMEVIDRYLSDSLINAKKDPSGFRYTFSDSGSGFKPVLVDSIRVNFTVKYLAGKTAIDNAVNTYLLSKLIKPWKTALPLYGEGAKITLYVPSGLAYGAYPTGPIAANANLIFDIKLMKVIREFSGQLQKDIAAIDTLLKSNTKIIKDASGVRYEITTAAPTNGILPLAADSVVITYTGKLLSDSTIFDQSQSLTGFRLNKPTTPKSWQKVFPLLKEGAKATLYVPSGLGYGAYGTTIGTKTIPAYANLKYEVELVKVIRK
jgi:FKBP-type peptidyl-prolyl cis-trans isomerase